MYGLQMRGKLDQWRKLAGGERWLLVRLAVLLPAIGGALRCFGISHTYLLLGGQIGRASAASTVPSAEQVSANRLSQLIDIVARHGLYPATCLRKSLALWWLLRRRGLPAELRIGVAKVEDQIHAHAWVEFAGRVINDRPTVGDDYSAYEDLDRRLLSCVNVRDAI
jgi:hypothetical protein